MFAIFAVFFLLVKIPVAEPVYDYSEYGQEEITYRDPDGETVTKFKPIGTNHETSFLALKPQSQSLYNWGRSPYHGVEGINYLMEDDDRTPYILCKYFIFGNDSDTLDHRVSEDGKTTRCYMDHRMKSQKLACSAMFDRITNPDNSTTIRLRRQGCHVHHKEEIHNYCNQSECIEQKDDDHPKRVFCCCNHNECNDELSDKQPLEHIPFDGKDFDKYHPIPKKGPVKVQTDWTVLFVVLSGTAIILIFVMIFIFIKCWKTYRGQQVAIEEGTPLDGTDKPLIKKVPISSLLVDEEKFDLSDLKLLCRGNSSSVYTAMLKNEDESLTKVAVKVFPRINKADFAYELQTYHYFLKNTDKCDCILHFIGWSDYMKLEYRLITEYHPMGNLRNYIQNNTLSVTDFFDLTCSALEGLTFLHEEKHLHAVAHRDIKTSNLLVTRRADNSLQAVIADFGFATKLDHKELRGKAHKRLGTHRYMPPEVIRGDISNTPSGFKSHDVYSMALVIWELLSRTDIPGDLEPTPSYLAAFEKEVPDCSIYSMKTAIFTRKIQLTFRKSIVEHPYLGQVVSTCREMWYYDGGDGEGRIASGTAYERINRINEEYKQEEVSVETLDTPEADSE